VLPLTVALKICEPPVVSETGEGVILTLTGIDGVVTVTVASANG